MQLIDVEAKAIKRVKESDEELTCLVYLEALGIVTAHITHNKQLLSRVLRLQDIEKEDYTQGVLLHVSGHYNVYSKRLDLTYFCIQKDA